MVLIRTGIALDSDLLKRFDRLIRNEGYENRSEAFRDRLNDASLRSGPPWSSARSPSSTTTIGDCYPTS
jgi:hypothetical protein